MEVNLNTEKCFICNKGDNLTKSPLHCGKSFYHQTCINEYCEQKKAIICPECKKNITNKFVQENTFTWNPNCGCKCSEGMKDCLWFMSGAIALCANFVLSFWVYSILPEPSHYVVGRLVGMCFIGLAAIVANGIITACTCSSNVNEAFIGMTLAIPLTYNFILAPFVLLMMGCASLNNPSSMSPHTVGYTYWILQSIVIAWCTLQFGIMVLILLSRGVSALIENCGCFGQIYEKKTTYHFNDGCDVV